MSIATQTSWRLGLAVALVCLAGSANPARVEGQIARGGGPPIAQAVAADEVVTALAHGDVSAARRAAADRTGSAGELASARVEMFVGQFDEARARLEPLANADPLSDAALELALLDLHRGRRDEAEQRLQPLSAQRAFNNADDYFRMARAAEGVREFLLANDAYLRVADVPRADIQSAWGDLWLRGHKNGDAAISYRDALAADPAWIPAHVGLARALVDEDVNAARAQLGQASDLAADHPDVLLFAAELQLMDKETDAARGLLDRLAEVRPGTVEEAALRAAMAYDEGGIEAAEAAMAAVRAADPTSALGYRRAGEQASRGFQFREAADLARRGTLLDTFDPLVHFDLGLYLMRTGDEAEARTALERSFELDPFAPVTKNLLDLLDSLDRFTVVQSGNLIFKFHPDEASVLTPYAVPLAQEAYETFSERYGFTPPESILIEVFPRHDDFAVRTLGLPGLLGALGACFGRVVTMDSPQARAPNEFSWQATLWHEMAHVFSLQLSGYKVPRWLTEGISQFEEHRRVPAWGRELTLEFARRLSVEETFGIAGLPEAFKNPETLALAYFEASLVVEHLVAENGDDGLRTLLLAYRDGATDAEAFTRAFGQTLEAADTSFAEFIDARYGALSRAMAQPPPADLQDLAALEARANALPDSYVSQLELGRARYAAGDGAGARAPLERAAALAPQAAAPRGLLATIASQEGDLERARDAMRAVLMSEHANIDAARSLRDIAGDRPEYLDFSLRLIADLNPFDIEVHGQLGRRLMERSDFQPALVEFMAALALGPPNLAEAHSDIAEALLRLDRPDEARDAALEALIEAPTFARAQDLFLEAIGRD